MRLIRYFYVFLLNHVETATPTLVEFVTEIDYNRLSINGHASNKHLNTQEINTVDNSVIFC